MAGSLLDQRPVYVIGIGLHRYQRPSDTTYVELGLGIEDRFPGRKPDKGFLYVGSTGKSVEERFRNNFTRKDGTVVSIDDAREIGEDGQWKWASRGVKRIRKHFVRFRPDLLYSAMNPISSCTTDPDKLKRREGKLAKRLRNRGWEVFCDRLPTSNTAK